LVPLSVAETTAQKGVIDDRLVLMMNNKVIGGAADSANATFVFAIELAPTKQHVFRRPQPAKKIRFSDFRSPTYD
jgi:hypothetical protein